MFDEMTARVTMTATQHAQLTASLEGLRQAKANPPVSVFVATPTYDSKLTLQYCESILATQECLSSIGIAMRTFFLGGSSLINTARDRCAFEFLRSDSTHLLFADADQGWNPQALVEMLLADKDCVAGVIPAKRINWRTVAAAAANGELRPKSHALEIDAFWGPSQPDGTFVEHPRAGTGFMLIKRTVLEQVRAAHPELAYVCGAGAMHGTFTPDFEPNGTGPLGEDCSFCKRWTRLGGRIFVYWRSGFTHVSNAMEFGGDLAPRDARGLMLVERGEAIDDEHACHGEGERS